MPKVHRFIIYSDRVSSENVGKTFISFMISFEASTSQLCSCQWRDRKLSDFIKKDFHLCSEDEQKSYWFVTK